MYDYNKITFFFTVKISFFYNNKKNLFFKTPLKH